MLIGNGKSKSQELEEIIEFLKSCLYDYDFCERAIQEADAARIDYYHDLELKCLSKDEIADIGYKLMEVGQYRRDAKDLKNAVEPIVNYVNSSDILKKLSKVLGDVRKAEEAQNNRMYIPKRKTELGVLEY